MLKILLNGIIKENPTFVLLLGMCPTLATTTSAMNGLSMGLATMFVLICSNIVISMIKNLTPDKVRIPVFVVVIASFVTILQMCLKAYLPEINKSLGLFIPLILVNCIILGRAEALLARTVLWQACSTASASDSASLSASLCLAPCVSCSVQAQCSASPFCPRPTTCCCSSCLLELLSPLAISSQSSTN